MFFLIGLTTLLQLSFVVVPIVVLAYYRKTYHYLKIIPIIFALSLLDQFSLIQFYKISFTHWNWQGKIVEALWPLMIVYEGEREHHQPCAGG